MPRTTIDRFEQRKLTRAKLVEAALQLFSTSGYDHATVDDISQAAGYSKGAYYFHFSTKDDILMELLRVWTEDRNTVLSKGAEPGAGPRESLHQTLANFFSYSDTPQWPGVLLEFWAQAVRNTQSPRSTIRPLSSATGMKSAALRLMPSVPFGQRTSASTAFTCRECAATMG